MIVIVFTSTSDLKIVFVYWWVLTFNKWSKTQQNVADAIDFKSFCIFVLSTNYIGQRMNYCLYAVDESFK